MICDTPKARARKSRIAWVQARGPLWKHSTLFDIAGLAKDGEIATFFTLTLVRNPWDRTVSYYHWLRIQHFAHPAVGLAKTHSFADFLSHPQTRTALALLALCRLTAQPAGRRAREPIRPA